ncbi:GntR family transcriptional regulator [Streptomyces luteireticuli]|uniref:GntR family transcriptional regulator n=1 Tax=Streptomyces luteireticuli TaxID=173858 RepID=UPI003CD07AA9
MRGLSRCPSRSPRYSARADATYAPRRRVPSEAAICQEFGVSRPTARVALQLLIQRGFIITVCSKGSFVVEQPPAGDGDRSTD